MMPVLHVLLLVSVALLHASVQEDPNETLALDLKTNTEVPIKWTFADPSYLRLKYSTVEFCFLTHWIELYQTNRELFDQFTLPMVPESYYEGFLRYAKEHMKDTCSEYKVSEMESHLITSGCNVLTGARYRCEQGAPPINVHSTTTCSKSFVDTIPQLLVRHWEGLPPPASTDASVVAFDDYAMSLLHTASRLGLGAGGWDLYGDSVVGQLSMIMAHDMDRAVWKLHHMRNLTDEIKATDQVQVQGTGKGRHHNHWGKPLHDAGVGSFPEELLHDPTHQAQLRQSITRLHMQRFIYLPCGLTKHGVTDRNPQQCLTPLLERCTDEAQAEFLMRMVLVNSGLEEDLVRSGAIPKSGGSEVEIHPQNATVLMDGDSNSHAPAPNHARTALRAAKGKIVLVHPFGAHIWDEPNDLSRARGVALGLVKLGKALRRTRHVLLVLEAGAQHFVYSMDGSGNTVPDTVGNYTGTYLPRGPVHHKNHPGQCCGSIRKSDRSNYRNVALLAALHGVDPAWRSYMGWIGLYNMTAVDGVHVDRNYDCTHFLQSNRVLYYPLYLNMEQELIRLAGVGH